MTDTNIIMAVALIASAAYISYQWSVLAKYRRTLAIATYALEAAYIHITEGSEDEEHTD